MAKCQFPINLLFRMVKGAYIFFIVRAQFDWSIWPGWTYFWALFFNCFPLVLPNWCKSASTQPCDMRMIVICVAHIGRITVDGLAPHWLTMVTHTQWTNAGTWDVQEAMVHYIALKVHAVFFNSICQHITTTTKHYSPQVSAKQSIFLILQ
jgi:hypothetical protein